LNISYFQQVLPYLFFRNSDVPQQRITPAAMIAILSPSRSASSMKWVDRTMVRPTRCLWSKSHVWRRASGSIPDVGSSKMTTFVHNHTHNHTRATLVNCALETLHYLVTD